MPGTSEALGWVTARMRFLLDGARHRQLTTRMHSTSLASGLWCSRSIVRSHASWSSDSAEAPPHINRVFQLPNTRLKLSAPVVYGRIAFVNLSAWRRSLGAPR